MIASIQLHTCLHTSTHSHKFIQLSEKKNLEIHQRGDNGCNYAEREQMLKDLSVRRDTATTEMMLVEGT